MSLRSFLSAFAVFASCPANLIGQSVTAGPLTYQQALDLALARNLGLIAAQRQLAIRQAGVRIAGQRPNPDLTFEAGRDAPHEIFTFGLPLELGAKRGRRLDVAREELSLADIDVRTEQRTVRRNLRVAFHGLLAADDRVRLAESVVDIARRVRQAAQARFEEGAAPRLDVLQADLGVTRAEADLELARSARTVTQADVNAVLDQPPGQAVLVTGDLAQGPATPSFEVAIRLASESNIDLLTLERQLAIERRRTSLLRAERTPTPVFSVGAVLDAPGEFEAGLRGGISVTLPLFTRNQGEIAQALATLDQLGARREAVRRSVESAVFGGLARMDAERRQVDLFRTTLVPTATSLEDLAEESYRLGRSSVLAVLDAQRTLRDVRREYLQALQNFQTAVADIEEILGAPIQ